jgi:hypothetical protein
MGRLCVPFATLLASDPDKVGIVIWKRDKVIPLQGGLGNQLFEMVAGFALKDRDRVRVSYSTYWLDRPEQGETPRSFALEHLLRTEELTVERAPRTGWYGDRLHSLRVIETSTDDDSLGRVRPWTRYVAGYFQRLEYVELGWRQLIGRLSSSPDGEHRVLAQPSPREHGAVHYRLGDYVHNASARETHGVAGADFYAGAIGDLHKRRGVDRWILVSDDLPEAEARIRAAGLPPGVTLEPPAAKGEWSDLAVLATSRACVISNSSFSWWGAYLGHRHHSVDVVAPSPWFASLRVPEPPIFPEEWTRAQRSIVRAGTDT